MTRPAALPVPRMAGDWIRLHRKSLDSRVFSDPWLWKVWCWCLMRAHWEPCQFERYDLSPGQFATGLREAAIELNASKSSLHRSLHLLQRWGQITLESGRWFTVVTVCNWATYQTHTKSSRDRSGTEVGQMRDRGGTPSLVSEERQEGQEAAREDLAFARFWNAYPRKKSKADAKKAWDKLRVDEPLLKTILEAIAVQCRSSDWLREDGQFIPYPASWLNARRWEDEVHVKRNLTLDAEDRAAKIRLDRIANGQCPVCGKSVIRKECVCTGG